MLCLWCIELVDVMFGLWAVVTYVDIPCHHVTCCRLLRALTVPEVQKSVGVRDV